MPTTPSNRKIASRARTQRRAVKVKTVRRKAVTPSKKVKTAPAKLINAALLQPRFQKKPSTIVSSKMLKRLNAIDMRSVNNATRAIKKARFARGEVAGGLNMMFKTSATRGSTFAQALAASWSNDEQAIEQSHAMLDWARGANSKQRSSICKAMVNQRRQDLVIHNIGGMNRTQARTMMKDFLASGGKVDDVAQWLREAGAFLNSHDTTKAGTDGLWGSIKKVGKKAVKGVKSAVKTVGDALSTAVKNLGKAIASAAKWTASKIRDFVRGLISAGKSVVTILREAVKQGAAVLNKFVKGVIQAGRSVLEVMNWAYNQAASQVKQVVSQIIAAGKSLAQIVSDVIRGSVRVIQATVKALRQLGKRVYTIIQAVASRGYSTIHKVVGALLKVGTHFRDVVIEAAKYLGSAVNHVIKSIISLGKSVFSILKEVATRIAPNVLKNVVNALLKAGKSVAIVLKEGIKAGVSVIGRVSQALISLGQKIGNLLSQVVLTSISAASAIIKEAIRAGRTLAAIVKEGISWTDKKLRNFVEACYQAAKKAKDILVAFARRTVSAIRTVLEGLMRAGLTFAKTVSEILVNVQKGFHKGFFQGLIALGKSAADIMVEALKLTAALAILAFTAILEISGGYRPLTKDEIAEAKKIFGTSINLSRVKVSAGNLAVDLIQKINGGRAFTTMYLLNFASWKKVDKSTLIHELTHVWQSLQKGPIYAVEALEAQLKSGKKAYDVTNAQLDKFKGNFDKFNPEQQATIVEHYWRLKFGGLTSSRGLDVNKLEPYAKQVLKKKKQPASRVRSARVAGVTTRAAPVPIRVKPAAVTRTPLRVAL